MSVNLLQMLGLMPGAQNSPAPPPQQQFAPQPTPGYPPLAMPQLSRAEEARRAAYARSLGEMPGYVDIMDAGDYDEQFAEALLAAKGVVPFKSDLGKALSIALKRKPRLMTITLTDGTRLRLFVVRVRPRRKANYDTPAKRRDAARTLRAVAGRRKRDEKLASAGLKLARATGKVKSGGKPRRRRR